VRFAGGAGGAGFGVEGVGDERIDKRRELFQRCFERVVIAHADDETLDHGQGRIESF
jgi:hypothetical protein